jgi:hypothetical protein
MKDWYALNIEEPVREVVRALRNRGINTECSCGHKLYIQFQTLDPQTELTRKFLFRTVLNKHSREIKYTVVLE